jgi:hypothetical protein
MRLTRLVGVEPIPVVESQSRILVLLPQEEVPNNKHVNLAAHKAAECVVRGATDRLAAHVEAGIYQNRTTSERLKPAQKGVITGVRVSVDRLNPRGVVDVCNRWNLRSRYVQLVDPEEPALGFSHFAATLFDDVGDQQHVGTVCTQFKPFGNVFPKHRWLLETYLAFAPHGLRSFRTAITGVMENPVADHDVDAPVAEWRAQKIHLEKGSISDPVSLAEAIGQPQRVDTNIAAKDATLPRQPQEICQLPGAATGLKHDGPTGELLIECGGEVPFPQFGDKTFTRVEVIVVGEGRFLVKRLNCLGNATVRLGWIDRREEPGNALYYRIMPTRAGADPALLRPNERLTGYRACVARSSTKASSMLSLKPCVDERSDRRALGEHKQAT